MYIRYLTLLSALAFLGATVVGQPPVSTSSPTINGPRSPAGHDDHSHNRKPVARIPTTLPPSKITLSEDIIPTVAPVAKPPPNPPRPQPTKNRHHRGPTDSPVAPTTSPPTTCELMTCPGEAQRFQDNRKPSKEEVGTGRNGGRKRRRGRPTKKRKAASRPVQAVAAAAAVSAAADNKVAAATELMLHIGDHLARLRVLVEQGHTPFEQQWAMSPWPSPSPSSQALLSITGNATSLALLENVEWMNDFLQRRHYYKNASRLLLSGGGDLHECDTENRESRLLYWHQWIQPKLQHHL